MCVVWGTRVNTCSTTFFPRHLLRTSFIYLTARPIHQFRNGPFMQTPEGGINLENMVINQNIPMWTKNILNGSTAFKTYIDIF